MGNDKKGGENEKRDAIEGKPEMQPKRTREEEKHERRERKHPHCAPIQSC